MTDITRVGDSGVHTVEGNVAGGRAAMLTKQRDQQRAQYEAAKNKIKDENTVKRMDQKFNAATESLESEFRAKTVGLVTADDFRKAREDIDEQRKVALSISSAEASRLREQRIEDKKAERDAKRKKVASKLSFNVDDGDSDSSSCEDGLGVPRVTKKKQKHNEMGSPVTREGNDSAPKKIFKNPFVDTTFLPDLTRDRELIQKKEALKEEWLQEQARVKNEMLEVVYSYWDGSGHRKAIELRKGTTIGRFLELVKVQLAPEFHELRSTNAEDLMYIKEDLIIPQFFSFYDLIITKARGKSGPLFHFDVHDDIRLINDATVEKDESHPGKICDRRWYEKNKHIFPASRWEIYDPKVNREAVGYTIHGGEVAAKKK